MLDIANVVHGPDGLMEKAFQAVETIHEDFIDTFLQFDADIKTWAVFGYPKDQDLDDPTPPLRIITLEHEDEPTGLFIGRLIWMAGIPPIDPNEFMRDYMNLAILLKEEKDAESRT